MSKKYKFGIVAIILSIVLFLQSVPTNMLSVLADGISELLTAEETIDRELYSGNMIDAYNIGESYIIQENVKNRTATTREYLMSDNTIMVQQFAEPVHYYDNGEYKDIDNTLIEEEINEKTVFTNKANTFKVVFNEIASANNTLLKIEEDGDSVSFRYDRKNDKEIKGQIKSKQIKQQEIQEQNNDRPSLKENKSGQISYSLAEENTDITYEINNAKLTQKIVVNSLQKEYIYTFTLKSSNLQYLQKYDGSIEIYNRSGVTKFVMPTPKMVDANGNYCNDVEYVLKETEAGANLTIIAKADWLNNKAKFPVTILPEIRSAKTDNQINCVNLHEEGQATVNTDEISVGKKNGDKISNAYINFKLPKVPSYYQLIGTSVKLRYKTKGMSGLNDKDFKFNVKVVESAENLTDITNEKKPKQIRSLKGITKTSEFVEKELEYESEIISPYNLTNDVLTLAVETDAGTSENAYITLSTTTENTSTVSWYQRTIGLKDQYSVESFSINGATSYVNAGSGQLTSVIELASVNTLSDIPFSASIIYNDYYDELLGEIKEATGKTISSVAGACFKLNYQQFMLSHDNVYELIDADGSISTFSACQTNGIYYSRDKNLYYNSVTRVVQDLVGNQMHFDSTGCLTKIINSNNQTEYICILYTGTYGQIDKVDYYANSVKKHTIDFTYVGNNLTSVSTDVDTQTPYRLGLYYDTNNENLLSIKNHTGNDNGVQMLSFVYKEKYFDTDPNGMLNYIQNNQSEIMVYDRNHSNNKIYEVRNANAASTTNTFRCNSSVEFGYHGMYTELLYHENGTIPTCRYVSFNNSKEIISEWQQDSKGIVSVKASTNWKTPSANGTSNYTKETITYYHKSLPINDMGIGSGNQSTVPISSESLDIPNHENYRFAIVFQISTSSIGEELITPINLSVKIGSGTTQNISLNNGGKTYVAIPCQYYDNTTVTIKNNGEGYVVICYFSYALIDSVQEWYVYNSQINAHNLSSTTINLRSGKQTNTTYDDKQRVSEIETSDISTDAVKETIKYSYFDESSDTYVQKGKIENIITTTSSDNTETERKTFSYAGTWGEYTETVTIKTGTVQTQSKYNITRGAQYTVVTDTDENNLVTTTYYKPKNGDIRPEKIYYNNLREEYTYNNLGQITNVNVFDDVNNTLKYSQTNNYDSNGNYLGSSYGDTKYTFGYEDSGYVTSIGYGGTGANDTITQLLGYSYYAPDNQSFSSNKLYEKTYANGNVENYLYSENSSLSTYKAQVDYSNSLNASVLGSYVYEYNHYGQIISQSHKVNGETKLTYDYGKLDNLEEQKLTISGLEFHTQYTKTYDTRNNNRLDKTQLYSIIGCSTTDFMDTYYYYDNDGLISSIKFNNQSFQYSYDDSGRLIGKSVPDYLSYFQNESYSYKSHSVLGNSYTTNLLQNIDDQTLENNDSSATYDSNGYVTSVTYNGNTHNYSYDNIGRLVSETANGSTTTYQYDDKNDITNTGYVYTNGKLTRVNGLSISYDAMGNPIRYKGNTFNWEQGRKLVSGSMNGNSFSYAYDGNGMRYEKKVSGIKTNYYYDGTTLLMESKNGVRTWYIYGVTGIEGMIVEGGYQDTVYYFDKNTLGDIIAIRNSNGEIIATYDYDAWGNVTVMDSYGNTNTNSYFIGNINPFRYRGYYYDNETGFYYLQTRYYDPSICRFINADNYELVSQLAGSKELNMYAYCRNNPIMYTDETGEGLFLIISLIVGAVAGAIIGGVTAACNGAEGWGIVGGIALGAVLGTAGGALFASGSTAGYIAVRGSLLSATKFLSLKRSVALGLAIFDIIGSIAGPLLGVDWELVEWGPGTPENTPNKTPYSDISGMSTTALAGKYNIAKYYAV